MAYWFQDPGIKSLLPLATSTSIKGLVTFFNSPALVIGANSLAEAFMPQPSIVDIFTTRCERKRAFFVTDEFSERFARKASKVLEGAGFATCIWNRALPEAPIDSVRECAAEMTRFEPDMILAVGGGSVIDTAKAAWVLYERPDVTDLGQVHPLNLLGLRKKAGLAAIPTTSGTGSECTMAAVLHDTETRRKVPIANGDLFPDIAILDPEFTMSMPPTLTAGTGLDALAHAVDGVMTPASNDITDAMGLRAIRLIFRYLPRAYRNGKDREARLRMHIASSMAGMCFGQNSCALTHGFGHAVGGLFGIHHGLSVGMFIPYAMQYYRSVTEKYLEICDVLAIPGRSPERRFASLMKRVKGLFGELDVPPSFRALGIERAAFEARMEEMVLFALEDIDTFFSPRPVTREQAERILRCAYDGRDVDF
ncbi:MAG TPA: iron-containing alcohol dehydrogenase [Deltaproteobacteria bacterium]|nr:iron-containing alcohol dehydrogenase [Deltaproteobacteria bacterium]HQI80305.1 iron-containing alcohol dehydrogenase [Deltaproteobacteria bacterium]